MIEEAKDKVYTIMKAREGEIRSLLLKGPFKLKFSNQALLECHRECL